MNLKIFEKLESVIHTTPQLLRSAEILKCDDVEYSKLLEFINCPALENWKVHIVDYKKALDIHI